MGACSSLDKKLTTVVREVRGIREDVESIQRIEELLIVVQDMQMEMGKVAELQAQVEALQREVRALKSLQTNLAVEENVLVAEQEVVSGEDTPADLERVRENPRRSLR